VTEQYEVPATLAGERVDRAVALLTGWTRVDVQALIAAHQVEIDGRPVIKSRRLEEGEIVDVLAEPEPVGLPGPEDIPIVERWSDADVIVISKPPGLVVHPGAGNPDGTLANALLHHHPELAGVGEPTRPGIVHRLDRDTSGVMVLATDAATHRRLSMAFEARQVEKSYHALVAGHVAGDSGQIDLPLRKEALGSARQVVCHAQGRPSRTRWFVEARLGAVPAGVRGGEARPCTLVRLEPLTGRSHQLRVHIPG